MIDKISRILRIGDSIQFPMENLDGTLKLITMKLHIFNRLKNILRHLN